MMKLTCKHLGLGVVFGAALVGGAARGGIVQVGSADAPVQSGVWSQLASGVSAGDEVELYAASGAEISVDGALSLAALRLQSPTAVSFTVAEGGSFSVAQTELAASSALTVGGVGGALGAVTAKGIEGTANTLTLAGGSWTLSGLTMTYKSGKRSLYLRVGAGAQAAYAGELCCNNLDLAVSGKMTVSGGMKSASASYRSSWVAVNAGGTLQVTGDYAVAKVWAAQALTIAAGGTLEVSGALTFNSGKTDSGNRLIVKGTLRAASVNVPMNSGIEVSLDGGCLVLQGNYACTPAQRWTQCEIMAPARSLTLSGGQITLTGDCALSPGPGVTLTLAPSALVGSGAIALRGSQGTVEVGAFRPRLSGRLDGTLRFTPTVGERTVAFACTPRVPRLNHVTLQSSADGWADATTTLVTGQSGWIGLVREQVPTLTVAGATDWNSGAWANLDGAIPVAGAVALLGEGTLTVNQQVSLEELTVNAASSVIQVAGENLSAAQTLVSAGEMVAQSGSYGALAVADGAAFLLSGNSSATVDSIPSGATVGVYGEGSLGTTSNHAKAAQFLLRNGTFRKSGEGAFTVTTYNDANAAGQSIEVTGGSLKVLEGGANSGTAYRTWQDLRVAAGTTLDIAATWGVSVTMAGTLRGEGTVKLSAHTSGSQATRYGYFTGETESFAGTLETAGISLQLAGGRTGRFGGNLSVRDSGSRQGSLKVTNSEGLTLVGALTLGAGSELDLQTGSLTVLGALSVEGTVTVTMPAGAQVGDTVLDLGEQTADAAGAANLTVSGFRVVADGTRYVLAAE